LLLILLLLTLCIAITQYQYQYQYQYQGRKPWIHYASEHASSATQPPMPSDGFDNT